mmetsp:Transcript_10422/g.26751  ORF Transcript_10422/g.26751 Transcript_10422/m.26751 type:complete len:217 (-) Transcript_10422:247-897(-)
MAVSGRLKPSITWVRTSSITETAVSSCPTSANSRSVFPSSPRTSGRADGKREYNQNRIWCSSGCSAPPGDRPPSCSNRAWIVLASGLPGPSAPTSHSGHSISLVKRYSTRCRRTRDLEAHPAWSRPKAAACTSGLKSWSRTAPLRTANDSSPTQRQWVATAASAAAGPLVGSRITAAAALSGTGRPRVTSAVACVRRCARSFDAFAAPVASTEGAG